MTAIFKAMQEKEAKGRKTLREQFFALARKPNHTEEDIFRLCHVTKELAWDDRIIRIAGEILRHVEVLENELQKSWLSEDDENKLRDELAALCTDWQEKAKVYDTKREELAGKIDGARRALSYRGQCQRDLEITRRKFAPLFGTGDKWGLVDDSIAGPFYDYLGILRRLEPENAAQRVN